MSLRAGRITAEMAQKAKELGITPSEYYSLYGPFGSLNPLRIQSDRMKSKRTKQWYVTEYNRLVQERDQLKSHIQRLEESLRKAYSEARLPAHLRNFS